MSLAWTKAVPTVGGWYFTRTKSYGVDARFLVVYKDGSIASDYGGHAIRIQTKHYEWSGPIEPPAEAVKT